MERPYFVNMAKWLVEHDLVDRCSLLEGDPDLDQLNTPMSMRGYSSPRPRRKRIYGKFELAYSTSKR